MSEHSLKQANISLYKQANIDFKSLIASYSSNIPKGQTPIPATAGHGIVRGAPSGGFRDMSR